MAPFFVDLNSLNEASLDHLRSVGLLPPLPSDDNDSFGATIVQDDESQLMPDKNQRRMLNPLDDEVVNSPASGLEFDPYAIRLLRQAHTTYLINALSEPLSKGFVSLDASHPWMVYWCLHSLDLLGYFDEDSRNAFNVSGLHDTALMDLELMQKGHLLSRIVSTLEACWTEVQVILLKKEVLADVRLKQLLLQQQQEQSNYSDNLQDGSYVSIKAGGFTGGPSQLPHCAPTYAAVLSLSVVASLGSYSNNSPEHPYYHAGQAALSLLSRTRLQMYAFFVSLRIDASELYGEKQQSTAFRMHYDGEVDVRAGYCLLAPAFLLGLLNDRNVETNIDDICDQNNVTPSQSTSIIQQNNSLLTVPAIAQHIATCQTYEGGFAAEPHNEAHGGYTFCALAALRILNAVHLVDINALQSWLARRQLGYEGGFCGRTNKLVDGCYSFWQGGALAVLDGWLLEQTPKQTLRDKELYDFTFDEILLQRYILLCAQDVNGGLRDKPSKHRDFYHSCYNLSGLSVAQHRMCDLWPHREGASGTNVNHNNLFGDKTFNLLGRTDPVINIRVERVQFMLEQSSTWGM